MGSIAVSSQKKVLPHDASAEQAFLGALLIDPSSVNTGITMVQEADFFSPRNKIIYKGISTLYQEHVEIDTVTLTNHLADKKLTKESGGVDYINQLLERTPTAANLEHYAKIIKDKATQRSLIRIAGEISELAFDSEMELSEITDKAETELFKITDRNLTNSYEDISTIVARSVKLIQNFREADGYTGLPTGFNGLDKLTSGLRGGQLIVVAGRPGSGKTAFCLNLAANVAINSKRPVLIYSLEMQKEELVIRLLCSESRIENSRLQQGMINRKDMHRLTQSASRLYETAIVIDDKPNITVNEARAKARRIKNEKGDLALVIFDYMQLVEGPPDIPRGDRYAIISEVSRSLKYLAKDLDVPVIALSQLSRDIEKRTDRRPLLSDLRESGQIEQDADIVGFIDRPFLYTQDEEEKNVATLHVRKHRNGQTGDVPLTFIGEYMRFEDRSFREPNQ